MQYKVTHTHIVNLPEVGTAEYVGLIDQWYREEGQYLPEKETPRKRQDILEALAIYVAASFFMGGNMGAFVEDTKTEVRVDV